MVLKIQSGKEDRKCRELQVLCVGGGGGAGRDQDWSDETKDLEMRKLNILELNQ